MLYYKRQLKRKGVWEISHPGAIRLTHAIQNISIFLWHCKKARFRDFVIEDLCFVPFEY